MSESEEFKQQTMTDKIAKEENENARELRDVAMVGKQIAQMENADIKKQNEQIDRAGQDADAMATDVSNTNAQLQEARAYSCASRKWLIIGIVVGILVVVVIIAIIAIILGVLLS
ncbi:hypothetical protein KM1_264370 [Entamoeba histolytica HM-3:IMSS]|nr:Hypothetical protein EHI5A_207920 [Entamoeba histolytica KU27]EMS16118.1 hypothetical protein KM1_264370 [Entamoeba histolytica HM-3:IMSS]ENY62534.1 hypothetical protein EHI7A_168250 [Entamoeba histolytica HM-1:IMSS-A]GAT91893.1 hypothetical protein CL6EHI_012060 [Entamoeba histolytica]